MRPQHGSSAPFRDFQQGLIVTQQPFGEAALFKPAGRFRRRIAQSLPQHRSKQPTVGFADDRWSNGNERHTDSSTPRPFQASERRGGGVLGGSTRNG